MGEKDTFVAVADGDQLNEGYFNELYKAVLKPSVVYTGTGFDTTQSGTGINSDDHTLQIAGGVINDFVIIKIMVSCNAFDGGNNSDAFCQLKIETQETGAGSWTDRLAQTTIWGKTANNSNPHYSSGIQTISLYYAPTAGEKSNGLDVKITSYSDANAGGGATVSASVTNIQTVIWSG